MRASRAGPFSGGAGREAALAAGGVLVRCATGRTYNPRMERLTGKFARVYPSADARAFDQRAIERLGIPGIRLMHRAGRAAFDALRDRWPAATRITVVCGGGNNGGDGYVLAGLAKDAGLDVQVVAAADPARLRGDALAAYRFAASRLGPTGESAASEPCAKDDAPAAASPTAGIEPATGNWLPRGDVIVDALLGTGATGEVRPAIAAAVERVNAAERPVLALDVPSGTDASSGALLMPQPVAATLTVTFVAAKLGLVTGPAVDCAGDVLLAPLDLPAAAFDREGIAVLDGEALGRLRRRRDAHKGDFGRLLVVGGDADMGGAVLLAGEAALRAGAGLVRIATRGVNRAAVLARRPELMVRGVDSPEHIDDLLDSASAVAVGPGLGRGGWAEALLARCLAAGKPLVVDADGLNALAARGGLPRLPAGALITPHPGEAGRLLGQDAVWVQARRPQAAAALSAHGAVAVLKGAGTLIAADGSVRAVCAGGNPGMATAGSGDVLTGVVAALLAQGLEATTAAELGVWLHARAGDEAANGARGALLASDLSAALRLTP